jgi:hypothetical protein
MKEFLPVFALQIKEKYNKGIQFPQGKTKLNHRKSFPH